MGERWFRGHWLGKKQGTGEHLVVKADGLVVRARAVRELEEKISLTSFNHLTSTPHDPFGTLRQQREPDRQRGQDRQPGEQDAGEREYVPKRVQITKEMVRRFGPTKNCKKCAGVASGDGGYQQVHHSEACRLRMEEAMLDDESFRRNLEAANNRRAERIVRDLECAENGYANNGKHQYETIKQRGATRRQSRR